MHFVCDWVVVLSFEICLGIEDFIVPFGTEDFQCNFRTGFGREVLHIFLVQLSSAQPGGYHWWWCAALLPAPTRRQGCRPVTLASAPWLPPRLPVLRGEKNPGSHRLHVFLVQVTCHGMDGWWWATTQCIWSNMPCRSRESLEVDGGPGGPIGWRHGRIRSTYLSNQQAQAGMMNPVATGWTYRGL